MTAPAPQALSRGPDVKTRVAAVVVVIALAALAAFAVFGGPTRVASGGGSQSAPATHAPSGGEPEDGGEGGFGD
jgi:hypothetical protein